MDKLLAQAIIFTSFESPIHWVWYHQFAIKRSHQLKICILKGPSQKGNPVIARIIFSYMAPNKFQWPIARLSFQLADYSMTHNSKPTMVVRKKKDGNKMKPHRNYPCKRNEWKRLDSSKRPTNSIMKWRNWKKTVFVMQ